MEQDGWIAAEWGISENNLRARYYRLTAAGRKQLAAEVDEDLEYHLAMREEQAISPELEGQFRPS
jgi:DNA-binding PadR family transcriptional regulator